MKNRDFIPHGSERSEYAQGVVGNCPGCNVPPGQRHIATCPMEQCHICHERKVSCIHGGTIRPEYRGIVGAAVRES